jgi:N-acetylmuramoyl-L-alanine amidase
MTPYFLIVHHSGGTDQDPKADSSNYTVEQCDSDHKSRGFPRSSLGYYVGYQYFIYKDGIVKKCREDTEIGAHTNQIVNGKSMNAQSIGICLAGNFDTTLPTEAQKQALARLLKEKMVLWSIPVSNIYPHRHYATYKSCYGDLLSDTWARELVTPPLQKVITKIINFFMTDNSVGHAVLYEVKNKATGEVSPVSSYEAESDQSFGVHLNGSLIVFPNGTYENGEYIIRSVDTHMAPDGITSITF